MGRGTRLALILTVLVAALILIVLAVLAELARNDFAVWFGDRLTYFQQTTWRVVGVLAFLLALTLFLLLSFKRGLLFQVQDLTERTLQPQLHIRCRSCGTVDRLEDTGARPLQHFCPKCGQTGEYAGPETGEKDFIYTRVEMKLGCTRCHTTFRIPEPLVRPLYTRCPNCGAAGIVRENQRAEEATEVPLQCAQCGNAFQVYEAAGHLAAEFPCPVCGGINPLPLPGAEPGAAPTA